MMAHGPGCFAAVKNAKNCNSVLVVCCTLWVLASAQSLMEIGQINAPYAAFVTLVQEGNHGSGVESYKVVISGFNPIPFFHDFVYEVTSLGADLRNATAQGNVNISAREINRNITWPNEVNLVPDSAFSRSGLVTVAGGFLVPFKDHGSLSLIDLDQSPPSAHRVTNDAEDAAWFYHRVQWRDMNGDGLQDMVTCRAQKPLFGSSHGQLVWFEQPAEGALSSTWRPHVIAEGPDTFFRVTSLSTPEGRSDVIITSGFFSQTLDVYWSTQPNGRWDDSTMIQHRVIDDTIGAAFDVIVADLDLDGGLDLLVSNNNATNASLFVYTVPQDFRTGTFVRKTLMSGINARTTGAGHGAPGSPLLVYPRSDVTSGKPWIVLSGDDDGRAYLLRPASDAPGDWSYSQTVFLDAGSSTVGEIAAGDVDGDGYTEILVPDFTQGRVHIYTFRPQSSAPIG